MTADGYHWLFWWKPELSAHRHPGSDDLSFSPGCCGIGRGGGGGPTRAPLRPCPPMTRRPAAWNTPSAELAGRSLEHPVPALAGTGSCPASAASGPPPPPDASRPRPCRRLAPSPRQARLQHGGVDRLLVRDDARGVVLRAADEAEAVGSSARDITGPAWCVKVRTTAPSLTFGQTVLSPPTETALHRSRTGSRSTLRCLKRFLRVPLRTTSADGGVVRAAPHAGHEGASPPRQLHWRCVLRGGGSRGSCWRPSTTRQSVVHRAAMMCWPSRRTDRVTALVCCLEGVGGCRRRGDGTRPALVRRPRLDHTLR